MAKREKFGKFVLLEEVDSSGLGAEYRAAKLSGTGLEKIVAVLRLNASLAQHPDAAKALMDQVKFAAQLQNPNILKIYGIGKVDQAYYISYEFLEGKSLKAIFNRCRQEGFPFSVDHALLIASKVCSALEYAHGRKNEAGQRYAHGLVTPANVLVSYEGEVRLRGFGYWPSKVHELGLTGEDDKLYLAPEQLSGAPADPRSDVFGVGALLFETLTGHPLFQGGRADDVAQRLAQARLQSPTSDDDTLPKPIADILQRALAKDPAQRYGEMQEMRKAIDTLLFSGDFTPTTFNLAFFMHSLFREDIDRESRQLKEEKDGTYVEYLTDDKPAAPAAAPAAAATAATTIRPAPQPASEATIVHPAPPPAAHPAATLPPVPRDTQHAPAHAPAHPPAHAPAPPVAPAPEPTPAVSAREAASGFTFHKDEEKAASKAPLIGGIAAVLLIGGLVAFFVLRNKGAATPPATTMAAAAPATTMSAEAAAAAAHVKELEERVKAMEAEKQAASDKAAADAKKKLEDQAKAKGAVVDPAAVAAAAEEARKKAEADASKKQAEEQKKIEEQRKTEQARLDEEKRKAAEAAAAAAAAATPPPTQAAAATTQPAAPAAKAGELVKLSDIGVIEPLVEKRPPLVYPPIAQRQRIEGTVELSVLVDDKGKVTDTQVVSGAGGKAGLNEAAVDYVKQWRYRAATKDGVPVKVWVPVRVKFVLPR